jgi:hypothetical protein
MDINTLTINWQTYSETHTVQNWQYAAARLIREFARDYAVPTGQNITITTSDGWAKRYAVGRGYRVS